MAMRVVHWYPNFLHGGGCANAVLGLATAEARQGIAVTIAAAAPATQPLYQPLDSISGLELLVWQPTRTLRMAGQYVRVMPGREQMRLAGLEPDVVHVHGEFNLDNLRVPRLFHCPAVISPHGACHPVVLRKSRRAAKRIFLAVETLMLNNQVRVFHALSPAEAAHLAALFPNVACYCVPQGPSIFVPRTASADATVDASVPQKVRFVFLGRLDVFTKGLDILLEAFAVVAREWAGARLDLVVIGPDWRGGRFWLRQRAAELAIDDRVEFAGALTGDEVGTALSTADIYVQLSRHEGFPLSVAEALLAGKPAVLSSAIGTISYPDIASLPHVKVVPPSTPDAARAMMQVVEDLPAMRQAACGSRQQLADFFAWDRIARLHVSHYMRLAHG